MKSQILIAAVVAASFAIAGCGETEQVAAAQKNGRYQGKTDGQPWDATPVSYGNARWTAGDKASWESSLRTRNAGQNEYVRTQ